MMNPVKPRRLHHGARIAVVAPSGPVNCENLDTGMEFYRSKGFKVVRYTHVLDSWGYLAGKDKDRASDMNRAFADPEVRAIVCARGGYGASRILDLLDYSVIAQNPKILLGYSDITGFHLALRKRTGLVTFHGPGGEMAKDPSPPDWNLTSVITALTSDEPIGEVKNPEGAPDTVTIAPGTATGRVVGGNLSLIAATLGTPYEIETRGCILLIEDVGERPYRIDRMLAQLKMAGKLEGVLGVVIGECAGCNPDPERPSVSLLEVFDGYFGRLGVPVFYGLACGHGRYKATIPLGLPATVDANRCILTIEETATIG